MRRVYRRSQFPGARVARMSSLCSGVEGLPDEMRGGEIFDGHTHRLENDALVARDCSDSGARKDLADFRGNLCAGEADIAGLAFDARAGLPDDIARVHQFVV